MTPRQADKLIKDGTLVQLYNTHAERNITRPVVLISRDRVSVVTKCGMVFNRNELEIAE